MEVIWMALVGFVVILVSIVLMRKQETPQDLEDKRPPTSFSAYKDFGLGPLSGNSPRELYIDLVKRAVANILYEDVPYYYYGATKQPELSKGFDLSRRVLGEDVPSYAHTMIGLRRLENIQHCAEEVFKNNVPGDFIETGVLKGGACIFMRALLKAHNDTSRRVFVCDAFVPPQPRPPTIISWILQILAQIPSKSWRRSFFLWIQKVSPPEAKAFPDVKDPTDDLVDSLMWLIQMSTKLPRFHIGASLEQVQSNFARYGLLDDQVVFLKGFFSDTLPNADIERISVLRLDGDTYESTMDAIRVLYPKLSKGGFCIVDDYMSFSACKKAIEDYRKENEIIDEIIPIDNLAVYWCKQTGKV